MSPIDYLSDIQQLNIAALTGITHDSRNVVRGGLFAALKGDKINGNDFISDAAENGARYILVERGTQIRQVLQNVTIIESDNPRRALSLLASEYYGAQPSTVVAIGGTNGKSSTVNFLRQLWEAQGFKAVNIGTLGIEGSVKTKLGGASMTTPDPIILHEAFKNLSDEGVTHCAIESSSHGLDQYRLDGVKICVGGFTSFSRDHLDYHGDEQSYFNAKKRQFTDLMPRGSVAVLNADIPEFAELKKTAFENGHTVIGYGKTADEFKIVDIEATQTNQIINLKIMGQSRKITLPLAGYFQAMNALCAFACAYACSDKKPETFEIILKALENLQPVKGRLQRIGANSDKAIYVDYAHTPDALETVLNALRPHTSEKLICLFGCGGDRDAGKRPIMGEIAARLADEVIITDDNPRSEDASEIRRQIMNGACAVSKNVREIENRAKAIETAVMQIGSGDVLLVAGKGHEQGQILKDRTIPFCDAGEVLKYLSDETVRQSKKGNRND